MIKAITQADLDTFDLAILEILQKDNTTPQRVIGERIGLSTPAIQRRIRRMEEGGAIQSNIAVVDPVKVGQAITLIVEVEMNNERAELIDAAKKSFATAPEIQQCYYVTGEADFVLILTVATMSEYEALTRRLFHSNDNIKRFRTLVAMDRVKTSLAVPIKQIQQKKI